MTILDYAQVYEADIRPRRRLRRLAARVVWVGVLAIRPRLALSIWRERR